MDLHRKLLIILISDLCLLTSVFGQTGTINVDQNHTGHRIYGLPTPTAGNEAATKAYADSVGGGGGSVSITATAPIVVTPSPLTGTGVISVDADLVSLAAASGTNTIYYRSAANTWSPVTIGSNMTFTGGTLDSTGGGGGGNVSNSGTPVNGQLAQWTDATHIAGIDNITLSQIPQGTNGQLIVGMTGLAPAWRTITGDIGISLTGASLIATDAVIASKILNNTVTLAKLDTMATDSILGRASSATGNVEVLSALPFAFTGDVTRAVDSNTETIANDAVTYAKMQNVSAISKLLGRGDSGAPGDPQEITLGTNLSMSGTTLNASGGGSGVTNIATTSPITGGPITTTGTIDFLHNVDLAMTAAQSISVTNASTATVDDLFTISHNSSGTGATGLGSGILFRAETSTTNDQNQAGIQAAWTNGANGNRTASMNFLLEGNASANLLSGMKLFGSVSGGGGLSVGSTTDPGQAGIINASVGYKVGDAAAGAGKILQGGGTVFTASTPTWPTASGAVGYTVRSDGTNFASYPQDIINSSVSSQSPSTSDVYITGSNVVVTAGDFKAKGQYRCIFDVTKSAGTGGIVISVRTGTAGTTSDTANLTFTFSAGTSVADVGTFEVIVNWRTVGTGTSAVVSGVCRAQKNTITAAGLWNDTSAAKTIVATVSSGFNSSTFTNMGVSFNGGTAFAGTITTVQASLLQ